MEPGIGLIASKYQVELVPVEREPFSLVQDVMANEEAECGGHFQARLLLKFPARRIKQDLTWINSAAGHLQWHVWEIGFIKHQ